ncbi:MAG: GNAT family N-acetyltransferase [Chloroflexota bacterium]
MMQLDFVETITAVDMEQIVGGLNEANGGKVPAYDKRPLNILSHDENGNLVGGLVGSTHWGWLYTKLLWVDPSQRGTGLGRQLMAAAEAEAQKRGCHAAYVNTFSFQAPEFYRKCGYEVWGELADYPVGETRIYLWKKLV